MRCLKRHVANEVYKALLEPGLDNRAGQQLRALRREAGIPLTVLADTLGVPRQYLQRLEIGTRAGPELETRAISALLQLAPPTAA